MMRQGVLIRGTNEGLTVYLNEDAEFDAIITELRDKFSNANDFFKGASITISSGNRTISPHEKMALINLCQEFELAGVEFVNRPMLSVHRTHRSPELNEGNTLIIKKTIRSGQQVTFKGNVIVIGDVNAGAEVIAAGDVVVMGYLRGVVHAGCLGDTDAEVYALNLQPTQLRIAHCIARSPDGSSLKKRSKSAPEKATIKDGFIVIEGVED